MKKIFTLLLITSAYFLQAQIPNNGFELWDNQPVPLQWETNSRPLTLPPYNPYIVVKDTDRYGGNFSANLIGNGVFHSWARTTFAISQHPASLSFYYKVQFAPCVNDSLYPDKDTVSVLMEVLHNGAVVDTGYREFTQSSSFVSWVQGTVLVSNNSNQFDSCRITITGGKVFGGCGFAAAATEFKVDELRLNNPVSCEKTGIVVQGAECKLIDTGSVNLLMPCNYSLDQLGFLAGDTIHFSFIPSSCFSFCMQGTEVEITCIDTNSVNPPCHVSVSLNVHHPTSYVASNGSVQSVVSNGTPPLYYYWSNSTNTDSTSNLPEGIYCVTVSDNNGCTATACDSLFGPHVCIDSALICEPGSLCCDAPLIDYVCGCDSVTYTNGCIATLWNGVTSYYQGHCVTTGVKSIAVTGAGIFVAPVPAKEKLLLSYELRTAGSCTVRVVNTLGETMKLFANGFQTSGLHKSEIDLTSVATGIYLVEVKTETERKIKMFVVE